MNNIILPKKNSNTGANIPEGYEKYVIPTSLRTEDNNQLTYEFLQTVSDKEMELENRLGVLEKELDKQSLKNIEIIGIFSAILALLIIDVNIIKSVESFFAAILLIAALTCSLVVFVSVIHVLFNPMDKKKLGKAFWIPMSILIILIIIGAIAYFTGIDLYKTPHVTSQSQLKTPIK